MSFQIIGPQISAFHATIAVPCKPIIIIKQDAKAWENTFIKMRDSCDASLERKQYNGCYAVLKWASCCCAKLVKVTNINDMNGISYIEFLFTFADIKELNYFCKDFYNCTSV